MRIAVISDLHANMEALLSISDVLETTDCTICLGDFLGYYCQVNEVIDFVRRREMVCILGNHDHFLLHGCPESVPEAVTFGIEYANRVIEPGHRRWLAGLPWVWGGVVGGARFLLAHGSPWAPIEDYLYPESPKVDELYSFDYDLIALGQTHRPMLRRMERGWVVNPGSVGQSRHRPCRACMAMVDSEALAVELIERSYNAGPVIELARRNGAGEWITKHLGPECAG